MPEFDVWVVAGVVLTGAGTVGTIIALFKRSSQPKEVHGSGTMAERDADVLVDGAIKVDGSGAHARTTTHSGQGPQVLADGGQVTIQAGSPDTADAHKDHIDTLKGMVADLKQRLAANDAELARLRASGRTDAAKVAALEAENATLRAQLADPEKTRQERQKVANAVADELRREANTLGDDKVSAAEKALEDGDFDQARALFDRISAEEDLAVQRKARAEFAQGEIAEADVDWHLAAKHYGRAAELEPTFDHLMKAREFARRAGDLSNALNLGHRLMSLVENGALNDEQTASSLNAHALTLKLLGRYDEAERLYRQALEIGRKTLGEDHPGYATRLNNLAGLLQATGRHDEAEPLYRQAIQITRKTLGADHPDYATRLNNLAALLDATGRYDEAEPLYRQALEIDRKTLGEDHPDYATHLNNLAGLLEATCRYDEAEPLYRQALEIGRKTVGEDHPDYGRALNNLAGLLYATGRFDEAEPLYRQAITICETILGPDHPNTKMARDSLEHLLAAAP